MPRAVSYLVAIALLAALPFFLASYHADVYRKMLLWVTLALGYSFLFGIAGQVAFSHFAFYGIGAYGVVILWYKLGLPLPRRRHLRERHRRRRQDDDDRRHHEQLDEGVTALGAPRAAALCAMPRPPQQHS